MVKWEKGWKIITKEKRISIISNHPVEYKKGTKTTPEKNNGPLAVFTNREAAEYFRRGVYEQITVLCKYIPSKEIDMWYWSPPLTSYRQRMSRPLLGCPKGTVLADAVVCLE